MGNIKHDACEALGATSLLLLVHTCFFFFLFLLFSKGNQCGNTLIAPREETNVNRPATSMGQKI